MKDKSPFEIAHCAHMACVMEASAEKPGNVTPTHSFKDTNYRDFLEAAERLEPFIERAAQEGEDAELGKLIYEATSPKKNVNFGIIIMFMPLAASKGGSTKNLIESLKPIDTRWIVQAMQRGRLGGMGLKDKSLEKYDIMSKGIFGVIEDERITPFRLMSMAQPYDTLAREWVKDYPISRSIARRIETDPHSIINEYLVTLAKHPDTLIARKTDMKTAEGVSAMARRVLDGGIGIAEFDAYLRADGNRLNPGTTADLIATGLFLKLIAK